MGSFRDQIRLAFSYAGKRQTTVGTALANGEMTKTMTARNPSVMPGGNPILAVNAFVAEDICDPFGFRATAVWGADVHECGPRVGGGNRGVLART